MCSDAYANGAEQGLAADSVGRGCYLKVTRKLSGFARR
jgi:hypothetical protein